MLRVRRKGRGVEAVHDWGSDEENDERHANNAKPINPSTSGQSFAFSPG